MSMSNWLELLLLGAVAGAVGQLVRAIAGFAKASRETAANPETQKPFSASVLVVSMLVGATAGALAAVAMQGDLLQPAITKQTILGLMAAGYAGADFIEGFAGRNFQGAPAAVTKVVLAPAPAPAPTPASPAPVLPPAVG